MSPFNPQGPSSRLVGSNTSYRGKLSTWMSTQKVGDIELSLLVSGPDRITAGTC